MFKKVSSRTVRTVSILMKHANKSQASLLKHQTVNFTCSCTLNKFVVPNNPVDFHPEKVVLVRKNTRYEYEKYIHPDLSEEKLKECVLEKGSDYDGLVDRHADYQRVLEHIQQLLIDRGIEVRTVTRAEYKKEDIDWGHMILTVGGDGTFLMAAAKVKGRSIPVVGINADPIRSEGYLCLPKKYSFNFRDALDRILSGQFRWMWRQRIRLVMSGKHEGDKTIDLHNQQLQYPEFRFSEYVKEEELYNRRAAITTEKPPQVLPILALNEVFIGESLSARVSFYHMSLDGSEAIKQKSSGITICTGTGSTSWFFNINHLPVQSVRQLLQIANEVGGANNNIEDHKLLRQIESEFNSALVYSSETDNMAYVIRDPVAKGIFHVEKPRGFCKRMQVKSRMWDGWVVVDGGISVSFNDGAVVDLSINTEDALRCIQLQQI